MDMQPVFAILQPFLTVIMSLQFGHYAVCYWKWMRREHDYEHAKTDATMGMIMYVFAYCLLASGGTLGPLWLVLPLIGVGVLGSIWVRKNHNGLRTYIRIKRKISRHLKRPRRASSV